MKDKISFVKMAYFYPRPRLHTHRAASSRPRSRRASPPSRCEPVPWARPSRRAHIGRTSATRPAAANRRAEQFGRAPLGPVPRDPRGELGPLFFVRARRMSARPHPRCARGKEAAVLRPRPAVRRHVAPRHCCTAVTPVRTACLCATWHDGQRDRAQNRGPRRADRRLWAMTVPKADFSAVAEPRGRQRGRLGEGRHNLCGRRPYRLSNLKPRITV